MKNIKKFGAILLTVLLTAFSMTACKNSSSGVSGEQTTVVTSENSIADTSGISKLSVSYDDEDYVSTWDDNSAVHITLSDTSTNVSGSGAVADGSVVTITTPGTYVVSGTTTNGQLVVNVAEKGTVRIILNNASITNAQTAPLLITDAKKVLVTVADGTTNSLTDSARTTTEAEEYSAALYSKADLVMNGSGTLNVNAGYNDGITSKDDLKIISGTIHITSTDDGIIGKDLLAVHDGTITVTAGGDGLKSTYDTDTTKGNIILENGTFNITSANDAVQAENVLQIEDGIYNINTAGGSASAVHTNTENGFGGMGQMNGQKGNFGSDSTQSQNKTEDNAQFQSYTETVTDSLTTDEAAEAIALASTTVQTTTEQTASDSYKGLKATNSLYIFGGTFTIDSQDDSLHTNGALYVEGGNFKIAAGDDAIHADETIQIDSGVIDITTCYEGIESAMITVNGGDIKLVSTDDGFNASTGSSTEGFGGAATGTPGAANTSSSSTATVSINGGTIYINAQGDGLDSNGSVTMTGGTVYVDGPSDNNNGALDYDSSFDVTGGTLIAAGSSGMAQAPSSSTNSGTISMTFTSAKSANTTFAIKDASGKTVIEYTPAKTYQTVVVTSPDITAGSSYTIVCGGTDVVTTTTSDTITYMNESGVTTGGSNTMGGGMNGGQMGGNKSGNTNDQTMPDMSNKQVPDGQSAPDMSNMQLPDGQSAPDMSNMQLPDGQSAPDMSNMPQQNGGAQPGAIQQ